jgi:4-hydroxybenzoate polyprenyltransferase
MRPANIVTAMADIMAGFSASGYALFLYSREYAFTLAELYPLFWLLLATVGLYGGGVVFNDVFDAELDMVERPERPIPSGQASLQNAALLGAGLFALGTFCAFRVTNLSGIIALVIVALALIYDKYGKHHPLFGPLNMGACRGANLLLGISAMPEMISQWWWLALIPITYIAAITMISRGEVHGGSRSTLYGAAVLYGLVIICVAGIGFLTEQYTYIVLPFLLFFAFLIFPPLFRAIRNNIGPNIGKAVKAGVIALIVMDAALAAGFAGGIYGLVVLALLPVSIFLARKFAVT